MYATAAALVNPVGRQVTSGCTICAHLDDSEKARGLTNPPLPSNGRGEGSHLTEVYDLNKRKRVAQQKHRARQRKIEEKARASRGPATASSVTRTRTAEPERMAPLSPTTRPPAPRRPRTTPRPAGSPQGSEQRTAPRPPASPRRPAQPQPAQPEEPKASGEAPSGEE